MNGKKKKLWFAKRLVQILSFVLVILMNSNIVFAATDSYSYSGWREAEEAPPAYELDRSLHASDLGVESLSAINDLFVIHDMLYIAANNCIIILDKDFNKISTFSSFDNNGVQDSFVQPNGLFVTENGDLYVADPEKGVIYHFDADFNLLKTYERPEMVGLEDVNYQPLKIAVDDIGRIYVLAKNVYEGIIELNPDGSFNRFVGANKVSVSIMDLFWRSIATDSQLSQMELMLPTDYSDISLDKDGFIYATVQGTDVSDPIRKLNSKGSDIMPEYSRIPRPSGDFVTSGTRSNLTRVTCSSDGRFAVLDSTRSRIFVYNDEARLLYIFGGNGTTEGQFRNPIDLTFMGDSILVADSITASIEVFTPTEYGSYINEATYYQSLYEYEKAAEAWEKVITINPNFEYAYVGVGKQEIRDKNYSDAVDSFQISKDLEYYSSSFAKVRETLLETHFGKVIGGILIVLLLWIVIKVVKSYRRKKGLKLTGKFVDYCSNFKKECISFPCYILSHPFKGFDEIKYEKKGNLSVCIGILAVLAFIKILRYNYISFMVMDINKYEINSILLILTTIFPYVLFVTANWSITTLMDGKGTYSEIFKVNMYALYPKIFLDLAAVILSNVLILEEIPVVMMLFGLSTFLYCFYLFIGLVVIHGFTFFKGVGSILLTFVAMAIVVFILLLLVTLVGGFIDDIYTIVQEFTMLF